MIETPNSTTVSKSRLPIEKAAISHKNNKNGTVLTIDCYTDSFGSYRKRGASSEEETRQTINCALNSVYSTDSLVAIVLRYTLSSVRISENITL